MHGKMSKVKIDTKNPLFKGLPSAIEAARYHSLAGIKKTLPQELEIIAETTDGEVMAVCHKKHPIYGLQFHPESILTPKGRIIIENFLRF
jgi:anthranilate synthase component 2